MSHRAGRGDPLELDLAVDVGGVAGEGHGLVQGEDDPLGRLHLNDGGRHGHYNGGRGRITTKDPRTNTLMLCLSSGMSTFIHLGTVLRSQYICSFLSVGL